MYKRETTAITGTSATAEMVSTAGATAEIPGTSTAARTSETAESTAATKTTGTSQTETERAATTVKPATVGAQQLVKFHGKSRKISIKHKKSMKNAEIAYNLQFLRLLLLLSPTATRV
jgi:hypothetical protein